MILHGVYDLRLVGLSVVLAILAAYTALDFSGKLSAIEGRAKWFWLAGGATALGLGICSMHSIGMLAFALPVPVLYHYPTVIVSLIAAILASAVALFTASRARIGRGPLITASLSMGGAIAAMHYIGMAAMRLPAMMQYNWLRVALSVMLAVLMSLASLTISGQIREDRNESLRKTASAIVLGAAIALMHFSGMWAVQFYATPQPFSSSATVRISFLGAVVIAVSSFLVMLLVIVAAFVDHLLLMRLDVVAAARDGEARFRLLAEAIPEIVWTAVPAGDVAYCNQRWFEVTGLSTEQALGWQWEKVIHPDDLPVLSRNWEYSRKNGVPFAIEYRIRTRAHGYRWFLVRATPMRDSSGAIIHWFGSCTDVDDQMRNQQVLEEQIKHHTAALLEANARLETEMRERALAQEELNRQNERMVSELTRRSQRATMLARMAELLQGCAALSDVFSVAAGMAPKLFPGLRGAVLLLTSSRDALETAVSWNNCSPPAGVFGPQDCWALRRGHMHLVMAGDTTAACRHAGMVSRSYVCLPLMSQGESIGILHFQCGEVDELPESELSLATTFAEQIGLSVSNLRLREALRNQSIRDPLTGLFNRRYLEETMLRETRRAIRAEHNLGVILLDLDHFKSFNDTYGHDAGDTVLRQTSSFLTKSVRSEDIVCRFGGEEFLVILPMADAKTTIARAERIRSHLPELPFLHQGRSLGVVTVSIGVAILPEHGTDPKALFEAADAALYRAKREGRDRVVLAEAVPDKALATENTLGATIGD